jgi:carbonic anhydrase
VIDPAMRPRLSLPVVAAALALAAAPARPEPATPAAVVAQLGGVPTSPAFRMEVNKGRTGAPEATSVGAMPIETKALAAEAATAAKAADAKAAAPRGAKGPDAGPAGARPKADGPVAAGPAGGASAPQGSMDLLRAKLAEKLGATPSKDNRFVMRVSNRGESGENVITAVHGGTAGAARRAGRAAATRAAGDADANANIAARGGLLPTPWDYAGAAGPDAWGRLGYETCARGQRQSPIDIRGGIAVDLEPIRFDYRPGAFSVIDNGHTVEVDVAPGSSITVTGHRYELQQFHFHRPSEERVDGRQFDMSVHLVHKDAEGRLAVVAVLLDRGSAQPVVQAVWNNLPLEKHEAVRADTPLDPAQLLPDDRRYYTYMGSLTTPPCSEGVLWMVMQHPVPLSPEQLSIFARLYPMNARPIQQADGRLIKQSN